MTEGSATSLSVRSMVLAMMVVLGLYIAALGIYVVAELGHSATNLHSRARVMAEQYDSLRAQTAGLENVLFAIGRLAAGTHPEADERAQVQSLRAQVEALARQSAGVQASLLLSNVPPAMRISLADLSTLEADLAGMLFDALSAFEANDHAATRSRIAAAEAKRSALVEEVGNAQRLGIEDLAARERALGSQAGRIGLAIGLWGVLGIALAGVALLLFHRRLYAPLTSLEQGLARVADGDLEASLPVSRSDEMGRLSAHFNEMTRVLRGRPEVEELALKNLILSTQQETSLDGILVVDDAGRVLSANRRFPEVWGVPAELATAGSPDPPLHAAVREKTADPDAFLAGITYLYEHREERSSEEILLKDGRTLDRYSAPIMGNDGRYYGRVWYVRDVTARKEAEQALKASEEQFRTAFMTVSDAHFLVTRSDGRFVEVNDRFESLLGHSRHKVIGRTGVELGLFANPEDRRRMLAVLRSKGKVRNLETLARRKDGATVPVLLSMSELDAGGQGLILGVVRDLSEQKRVDEALRNLEEQFRQAQRLEAVGRFAGGVAHDFNNVLTVISGMSELLLSDFDPGDPRREEVEEIKKGAHRATALTRQLLAFSRRQVLQPQALDLNALVEGLQKMLTRLIGEDVILDLELAEGLGAVHADPGQIEQVIVNLAVNARDAMPDGGRLTIRTANVDIDEAYLATHPDLDPGRYVMVAVTDTGMGLDPEAREHIFEPFYTTKEPGKGTGLGLSTVHGIVSQSGGAINVVSGPGPGATFEIYLPRMAGPVEAPEARPKAEVVVGGPETVLLVEDDPPVRHVLSRALMQMGYQVLVARNGAAALDLIQNHHGEVELLVTDLVMPGMLGRELAETVAAARPGIRILYISGYTDDQAVRQGVLEGGQPYLQKPFTPQALGAKIREVLSGD